MARTSTEVLHGLHVVDLLRTLSLGRAESSLPGRGADEAGIVPERCGHDREVRRQVGCHLAQPLLHRVKERSLSPEPATDDDQIGTEAPRGH